MNSALLMIGNELLDGTVTDTNSVYLSDRLTLAGLPVAARISVPDDTPAIIEALGYLTKKAGLIVITGGLGPTEDDKTREAVAQFLGLNLAESPAEVKNIEDKFAGMGLVMPLENKKQAMVIESSSVINNPRGTAPGFMVGKDVVLAAFPGVPSELKDMFDGFLAAFCAEKGIRASHESVYVRTAGLGESALDEQVQKYRGGFVSYGTVASFGRVDLRLDYPAGGNSLLQAQEWVKTVPGLADAVFSYDRKVSLEEALLTRFAAKKLMLTLAESCTGGLMSKRFTDIAGSSKAFAGGAVVYSNELKVKILGVKNETLARFGAVSFETSFEMSRGLIAKGFGNVACSVTGIAGPDGGSAEKPVGTVFISFCDGKSSWAGRFVFQGSREQVRERTAARAVELMWRWLNTGRWGGVSMPWLTEEKNGEEI